MLGELARANDAIDKAIAEFRLNEAANTLYEFIWGIVCDWYVELTKPILQGEDGPAKDETRAVTAFVLRETVKLLHPVMPFITEELWDKLGHRAEHGMLIGQPWPAPAPTDAAADAEIGWLVKLISDIRSARAELNVPAGAKLKLLVVGANDTTKQRIDTHRAAIERLARIEGIEAAAAAPKAALQIVVGEATYALPVGEVIDLKAEGARLQKEIKKLGDEIAKIDAKLGNAAFVSRAPEEVVEEQRERRQQAEQTRARLSTALKRLGMSLCSRSAQRLGPPVRGDGEVRAAQHLGLGEIAVGRDHDDLRAAMLVDQRRGVGQQRLADGQPEARLEHAEVVDQIGVAARIEDRRRGELGARSGSPEAGCPRWRPGRTCSARPAAW